LDKVIGWSLAIPLLILGFYFVVSAFWSRLPMPREWPKSWEGDISKQHIPLSRLSKLALALCVGSFGLSPLILFYVPRIFHLCMVIFALSLVAVLVTSYLDWLRAPGGDRTTFKRRFLGKQPPPFWNNPALSLRTKVLGGAASIIVMLLFVLRVVGLNIPEKVLQICFWSAMSLALIAVLCARYDDKSK
jgi:hypothetical protein